MQNTTNLNLKKPKYTDFADIEDINDNMDTIDEKLHNTKDSVVAFTSSDVADGGASSWTNVTKVASGEKHSSLFAKMSQMFKNIRFLYKLLGTTDISSIGNGTVTGGLSSLNDSLALTRNYVREATLTGTNLNLANATAFLHVPVNFRYAIVLCRFVTYDVQGRFFTVACYTNYTNTNIITVLDKHPALGEIDFQIGSSDGLPVLIVSVPGYGNTVLQSCEMTLLIRGLRS